VQCSIMARMLRGHVPLEVVFPWPRFAAPCDRALVLVITSVTSKFATMPRGLLMSRDILCKIFVSFECHLADAADIGWLVSLEVLALR
jgi:hypothetical protein